MTDTRYRELLPRNCRAELYEYLCLLEFWSKDETDAWIRAPQRIAAKRMGVTPRTIKRWERALVDLEILEERRGDPEKGEKANRRLLRIRTLREAQLRAANRPPSEVSRCLETWGQRCHQVGDRPVPILTPVPAPASIARVRHQTNSTLELNPHTPTLRKPRAPGLAGEQALEDGLAPPVRAKLNDARHALGVWANRWRELDRIVERIERSEGTRQTVEAIDWARREIREKGGTKGKEGARFVAMLEGLLASIQDKRGPRSGRLAHA